MEILRRMIFKCINSGSAGNSYILTDSNGIHLIIELGVNFKEIKKAIDFDVKNVAGAIYTHEHLDHFKCVKEVANFGIEVFASKGTLIETGMIDHHNANTMVPLIKYKIGPYRVLGFPIEHDVREPFGFVIQHEESGSIVFLTDSIFSKYTFTNINHFVIESNYDEDLIGPNSLLRNRIISSHMSIQNTLKFLEHNDLSKVNNIVLIHLSDTNSNKRDFIKKVEDQTLKTVHVAEKGLSIPFGLRPF